MDSPHILKERLYALMFDSVRLTEEEDAHITGWRCAECHTTMLELTMDLLTRSKDDAALSKDEGNG